MRPEFSPTSMGRRAGNLPVMWGKVKETRAFSGLTDLTPSDNFRSLHTSRSRISPE